MNLQAQFYGFGKALAAALRLGGETWVVTTACSSTTVALGLAQMLIHRGYYDTVLVGSTDVLCVALCSAAPDDGDRAPAPFSSPQHMNIARCLLLGVGNDGRPFSPCAATSARGPRHVGPIILRSSRPQVYRASPTGRLRFRFWATWAASRSGTGTEDNDKAETRRRAVHRRPALWFHQSFFAVHGVTGFWRPPVNCWR
jgi:hypothetical protein